ncbi:MAG: ORF6N domain-containing protein [Bacteroidales bacterium]|nr:ORF6N domain-containing protein [Bacteroidales bacterium]
MSQKNGHKEPLSIETYANCNSHSEVVSNCNHLENIDINALIRIIRGQQVLLDRDLAMLYGVETRELNQSVKRNIKRFPIDFMFQLNTIEWNNIKTPSVISRTIDNQEYTPLTSQNVILKSGRGQHSKHPPFAFTRNGIAMLSSVLRSETAVGVNIRIMRAFTAIPQFVNHSIQMVERIVNLENQQEETKEKINIILEKIEKTSPKELPEQIFQTGCVWDAWAHVSELVRSAKNRIILIDNYVDDRVLSMLTKRTDGVSATIHTRYTKQFLTDLKKHNEQYPEILFIQLPRHNHDRFLIIDNKVHLLGASLKDMGTGLCAITDMRISPETILALVN